MKLSLSRQFGNNHGYSHFMISLIDTLSRQYGVQIVQEHERSDIHFILVNGRLKKKSKNILRIDGVYYDLSRSKLNEGIKKCINKVDGVVFQSHWAKLFVTKMTGANPKTSTVIYNGSHKKSYDNALVNKYGFDKVFIACAHWRASKRPKAIIESFLQAKDSFDSKTGLFFVGEYKFPIIDKSIVYFNEVKHNDLYSLYRSSDYMCHICHLDACPNSVVEGLLFGLPVLCNNIGGTPELVGEDGIILPIDKPFNFKYIKSMNEITQVDTNMISKGMLDMSHKKWDINRPDLDISVTAKRYYDFFCELT